jgi:hypothetical protein
VLQPFSQGEMAGRPERFIARLLAPELEPLLAYRGSLNRAGYMELGSAGGYPEAGIARRMLAPHVDQLGTLYLVHVVPAWLRWFSVL